jgi:hypothetical protein
MEFWNRFDLEMFKRFQWRHRVDLKFPARYQLRHRSLLGDERSRKIRIMGREEKWGVQ